MDRRLRVNAIRKEIAEHKKHREEFNKLKDEYPDILKKSAYLSNCTKGYANKNDGKLNFAMLDIFNKMQKFSVGKTTEENNV